MDPNTPRNKPEEDSKVTLRKSLDDAFTAYVHDRHEVAREMYSAIIGTDPGNEEAFHNPEARFWRGMVIGHMEEEAAAAEDDFSVLLDINPGEDTQHWHARGIAGLSFLYFNKGEYNDANHHAQNALREGTNDPLVHCILGDAYWGLGRANEAVAEYRQAIDLDNKCFFAQDSIGFVEWQIVLGKWNKSEKAGKSIDREQRKEQAHSPIRQYKRALETRPDYVNALWNLAMGYAKIGDGKRAIARARSILSYNPDHEGAKDVISTGSTFKLQTPKEE